MSKNELYLKGKKILEDTLTEALNLLENKENIVLKSLSKEETNHLDIIIETCEQRKAVLTVLITLLSYKIVNPKQDIRNHQANMEGGFSGRTYDTKVVTPFMKEKKFPSMGESGWLTRSLEQNRPYGLKFSGKITPKKTKTAFLEILNYIETKKVFAKSYLLYLFKKLIVYRKEHRIDLIVTPLQDKKISITSIIEILTKHFESCSQVGKARLPVLAIYSIYECVIKEFNRYEKKVLQQLESHTSADFRSGEIGDISIVDSNKIPFEGVEIKYEKQINTQMIKDAYQKFKMYPVVRYYLLSTKNSTSNEKVKMKKIINKIAREHGCQVIVNGILPTIKYYLRLINDTNKFIEKYAYYINTDVVIKLEHKDKWNDLVTKYLKH